MQLSQCREYALITAAIENFVHSFTTLHRPVCTFLRSSIQRALQGEGERAKNTSPGVTDEHGFGEQRCRFKVNVKVV